MGQRDGRVPVLVVDDDREARELLCELIEEAGLHPLRAYDGREAMTFLRRLSPGFVVMDLAMPAMTGWEVLAAMKADPSLAKIPVVVVAGRSLAASGVDRSAITAYLQKPIDVDRFAHLASLLGRRARAAAGPDAAHAS